MQLPPPAYERLQRALAGAAPQQDQRQHARIPVSAPASVLPLFEDDSNGTLRARVADVSPQGIALLHSRPMTVGGEFLLHIPSESADAGFSVRCLVRSSTLVADNCYRIGAEFDSLNTKPCLLSIGAQQLD